MTDPLIPPTVGIFDSPVIKLSINPEWWAHVSGQITRLLYADEWDGTDTQIEAAIQQIYKLLDIPPLTYLASFWETPVPSIVDSGDGAAVELGIRFHTNMPGQILGLRFYKAVANTGEHHGYLYDSTGTLLGELAFVDETASGWQTALFEIPISIQACQTYTASYHAPNGHYSKDAFYLTSGYENAPLFAEVSGDFPGTNGVYGYGDGGNFPHETYEDTNYWVDVIFKSS